VPFVFAVVTVFGRMDFVSSPDSLPIPLWSYDGQPVK